MWKPIEDKEKYIIESIESYPGIFPTRFDFLRHLFCVNGNGYEWREDGKIYTFNERTKNHTTLTYKEFLKRRNSTSLEDLKLFRNYLKDYYLHEKSIALTAKERSKIYTSQFRLTDVMHQINMYPLCEYSLIICFPDNYDRQWRKDMIFMANWIIQNDFNQDHSDKNRELIDKVIGRI